MNDISVIVVSWNAREFLRGCLSSLQQNGGARIREVLVFDNASSDGSPEMVAEEFPEVRVIRSRENFGFARANNLAIAQAEGHYLALINSDVILHPGCLEELVAFLETHVEAGLVGPMIFGGDGRPRRTCGSFPSIWTTFCRCLALDSLFPASRVFAGVCPATSNQNVAVETEVLSGCFWVARRQAVEEVGGLDERFFFYAEDVDWCRRFRQHGWKVLFVPKATAIHYEGGSSARAPVRYSVQMLRANFTYWRKYHGVAGQGILFLLSVVHHMLRLALFGAKLGLKSTADGEALLKWRRSKACLQWLFTGRMRDWSSPPA